MVEGGGVHNKIVKEDGRQRTDVTFRRASSW
jgi:hypothetical protein